MPECPYCHFQMTKLRTVRTCATHYGCKLCRIAFVAEGRKYLLCQMPRKHVPNFIPDNTPVQGLPEPPLVLSGGMDVI